MTASPMLALVVASRWQPGMVDPSPWTWGAAAAFLVAGLCAAYRVGQRLNRSAWATVSALSLFLAIDKILDLQNLFSQIGRDALTSSGYYAGRRTTQAAILGVIAMATIAAAIWRSRTRRRRSPAVLIALALTGFYAGRSLSLHAVDAAITLKPIAGGPTINTMIEIVAALGMIAAAICVNRG